MNRMLDTSMTQSHSRWDSFWENSFPVARSNESEKRELRAWAKARTGLGQQTEVMSNPMRELVSDRQERSFAPKGKVESAVASQWEKGSTLEREWSLFDELMEWRVLMNELLLRLEKEFTERIQRLWSRSWASADINIVLHSAITHCSLHELTGSLNREGYSAWNTLLSLSMTKMRWPMTNEIKLSVARSSPPLPPLLLCSSLLSSIYSLSPPRVLPKRVYSLHFYISTGQVERAPQFWDAVESTSTPQAFSSFRCSFTFHNNIAFLHTFIVFNFVWMRSTVIFIRCHTSSSFLSFPSHLQISSDLPVDVEVRNIILPSEFL